MKKLGFLLSLTTNDNDYQMEQAAAAEEAARRLGIDLQILYADNDAINQSQQLLQVIQSSAASRPDAIIFEPAGSTGLPQVARAATASGIGWVILNREVEYIAELRRTQRVPVFAVTSDHVEIGRIQGQQMKALLPDGGSVLYIQGPSGSDASQQRTEGMQQTKPGNIQVRLLRAQWTEGSSYQAVSAWLRLSTSRDVRTDLVSGQDDSMAMGARKAFQETADSRVRDRLQNLLFTGCDGMPKTGQAWVRSGLLAATIVVPPNAGMAVEMLAKAAVGNLQPAERTFVEVRSFPPIEQLAGAKGKKGPI